MLFVVKLLVIVWGGGTAEVGDSTRGSLGDEVMVGLSLEFEGSNINEGLLARFEGVLGGCGEAGVA